MAPRRTITVVALAAGSLVLSAAGPAAACPKPGKVTVRQQALGAVEVSWRPSATLRRAGASYRVLRGRDVVGQTRATSMVVRGVPGRRLTVRVGVVGAGGAAPACWTAKRTRVARVRRVAAPHGLTVRPLDDRTVEVHWRARRGATAYRLLRDGDTVGQTRSTRLRSGVRPGETHAFRVVPVGAGDRLGRPSAALTYASGHRPPSAPADLAAPVVTTTSARLTWGPAVAGTAPVRGYRVTRDGQVVGQFPGTTADLAKLVHDRTYAVGVAAVDTRGVLGPEQRITVRTSAPAPATGDLHAFVLASTDSSFAALQRHYAQVGVVYPTYFDCVASDPSQVKGRDDALITQWAKDRRILVLPRFNCQRPQVLKAIFADPARRATLIERLVALAVEHDYDGINLDFEAGAPEDRDALSAFVADLAGALHRAGRKLSVDVSPKFRDVAGHPRSTFYDYRVISEHADWVWVMSWGLHWQTSRPGPIAPADWLRKVYDYVATMPLKHKFVMGLPLYGFDWPAGGGPANPATALTYDEVVALAARHGVQPRRDEASGELTFTYTDEQGVPHEVWYGDGASVGDRFRIADERGLGGIGVWRLGQEDPAFWQHPLLAR